MSTGRSSAASEAANVGDYFGSATLQNLLHNLHTGRSPLQFIGAAAAAHPSAGGGGGGDSAGGLSSSSSSRYPFTNSMVGSVAEVLGRANAGSVGTVSTSAAANDPAVTRPRPDERNQTTAFE